MSYCPRLSDIKHSLSLKILSWKLRLKQGAKSKPHWAFVMLCGEISVPQAFGKDLAINLIDNLILARLTHTKAKLSPT